MRNLLVALIPVVCLAYTKDSSMVAMRDGIRLNTNIYKPSDTVDFPLPVLLERTPYGADYTDNDPGSITYITDLRRYILVVQDTRGRFESEGVDSVFLDDGWRDGKWDGYDTIEWIASQSWCNGKVGTFGGSALGITQYLASGAAPPHMTCAVPVAAAWDLYRHAVMPGGEYREYDIDGWLAGQGSLYMKDYFLDHYNEDTTWAWLDVSGRRDSVRVPMCHIAGWYDMFSQGNIEAFCDLQYHGGPGAAGNQRLLVGPWSHNSFGETHVGEITFPNASYDIWGILFRWMNYWLKGDSSQGVTDTVVQYYLMGPVDTSGPWNTWQVSDTWPVPADTVRLYLREGGALSLTPPGSEDPESYTYDPRNPVSTVGGGNLLLAQGPYHQADSVWLRPDVLTYETGPLAEDAAVVGNVWLRLYASSDHRDTDFTAKLVDIYPDGRRMLILDNILMARHRMGYDTDSLLTSGQVYEFQLDLWPTAYVFPAGHSIGLAVSSSNHPRFRVNPNVPDPPGQETDTLSAVNTVFHDRDHPSALLLPVVNGWGIAEVAPEDPGIKGLLAWPNPFAERCRVSFTAPGGARVSLRLYDVSGRLVKTLYEGRARAGLHRIEMGSRLGPGVYYMVLRAGNRTVSERLIKR